MSDAATTQPLTFGPCYVTGQESTQLYKCGKAVFALSDLGYRLVRSLRWRGP